MRLLVASNNIKKLEELKAIATPMGIEAIPPAEAGGIDEVDETGSTFEENALLKAKSASTKTQLTAIADDSGLEVEALGGRPGVLSARYAGPNASDADRISKLLFELREEATNRHARFVCVIAIARPGGHLKTFRGEVAGRIIYSPRGTSGFGYDPVFVPTGYELTFAELPANIKNMISHRANALKLAIPELLSIAHPKSC